MALNEQNIQALKKLYDIYQMNPDFVNKSKQKDQILFAVNEYQKYISEERPEQRQPIPTPVDLTKQPERVEEFAPPSIIDRYISQIYKGKPVTAVNEITDQILPERQKPKFELPEMAVAEPVTTKVDIEFKPPVDIAFQPQPEETILDKIKKVVTTPFRASREELQAKAVNIVAISKMTDLPIGTVRKNYDNLTQQIGKETGLKALPTLKEGIEKAIILPITAGLVSHPVTTLLGIGGYMALSEIENAVVSAIKEEDYKPLAGKGLKELLPEDSPRLTKDVVDIIDFIAKALILGGIKKKAPQIAQKFTKDIIVKYRLPRTVKIEASKVADIFRTGKNISPEELDMLKSLNMSSSEWRNAVKKGITIEIPGEKIITIADKPYWAKLKTVFGKEPFIKTTVFREPSKVIPTIKGELPLKPIERPIEKPVVPAEKPAIERKPEIKAKIPVEPITPEIPEAVKLEMPEATFKKLNVLNRRYFSDFGKKQGLSGKELQSKIKADIVEKFGEDPKITLYRGITVPRAEKPYETFEAGKPGRYWDVSIERVKKYAGKKGEIYKVEVPYSELANAELSTQHGQLGEFTLVSKIQARSVLLKPEAVKPAIMPEVPVEIPLQQKNLTKADKQLNIKTEDKDVRDVQNMFNKQRENIEILKAEHRFSPRKVIRELERKIVDTSGNVKNKLFKSGDLGRQVVIKHDVIAGASSKSALEYGKIEKDIFRGLSKSEKSILNDYRQSRRTIEIEELGLGEKGIKSPGGLGAKEHHKYINNLKKNSPELYKKISEASQKIDSEFAKYLKMRYDNGLLGKESYETLKKQYKYQPRKFIQHFDEEKTYTFRDRKITVNNSGIRSLDKGSVNTLINDSELLLADYISRTNGLVFRNSANNALHDFASEMPDNGFVEVGKPIRITKTGKPVFKKAPIGKTYISTMIKGVEHRMLMDNEVAKEWVTSSPEISSSTANALRYLSGSFILKPMATGLNPEFAISNLPRDAAHILLTTTEYSSTLPIGVAQLSKDIKTVFNDAMLRKGRYIDFIKQGGGMDFLTHQGRLSKSLTQHPLINNIQTTLGYIGESSELLTRLALRERAIKNGKSPQEATWIARDYLDFSQGGSFVKMVDTGVPYLNAATQGTRGILRAAKRNPAVFTYKIAQIGGLALGLYYTNKIVNPECWDNISDEEKGRSWIITTPLETVDERDQKEYYYITIPKDQGQRIFAGLFEALAEKRETGKLPTEKLISEAKDFFPIIPTEIMPPSFSALLGYTTNKDFWTREDIWKGTKVIPKEEYYLSTPKAFVAIGKKTGISPVRLKRATQKLFTYRNIYTDMTGLGYRFITKDLPEKDKLKFDVKMISKSPFARRVFKKTYTGKPEEMTRITIEENTRKLMQNRKIQEISNDIFEEKARRIDMHNFIKSQPVYDRRRLLTRWMTITKFRGVSNWWLNLKDLPSPELKAIQFHKKWINSNKEERKELLSMADKLRIDSPRFVNMIKELQEELKTK